MAMQLIKNEACRAVMEINKQNMEIAKKNFNKVEGWINSMPPASRKPYSDSTFLSLSIDKLKVKVYRLVIATLKNTNLPDASQKFAAEQARKMVYDQAKGADKIYYVNLSDEWGGESDVFSCVMALCPDPDFDDEYYFFFGYYGERWVEQANVKINVDIWAEETIQGWLSYMLWKKCVDKLSALTI